MTILNYYAHKELIMQDMNKELLSEILGITITEGMYKEETEQGEREINMDISINNNCLTYWRKYTEWGEDTAVHVCNHLSIYELIHLYKEWIKSHGYTIAIDIHSDTVSVNLLSQKSFYKIPSDTTYTELEAICKAIEYVLSELKDQ
jgi:phage/plasmid-associated DNA primase